MKKFIYILNSLLLTLIPTVVIFCSNDNITHYQTDTVASTKMIKTTVLIDRSAKKKEEEESLKKKLQEEEERKRQEERLKEQEKAKVAIKTPVKVVEKVSSLASSDGASDATNDNNNDKIENNNSNNVGGNTTVIINPSEKVYVGSKLSGSMSAYGRDCCSSDPTLQGITASGYNIKTNGMYYYDALYGRVRILASDKNFPLYSIIKVNDPIDGEYKAIILDRGDKNIGFDRRFMFDLVVESQEWARLYYGVHKNINFEILRLGK